MRRLCSIVLGLSLLLAGCEYNDNLVKGRIRDDLNYVKREVSLKSWKKGFYDAGKDIYDFFTGREEYRSSKIGRME